MEDTDDRLSNYRSFMTHGSLFVEKRDLNQNNTTLNTCVFFI